MKELKLKELEFNDIYEAAEVLKNIKLELSDLDADQLEKSGVKAGIQIIINLISGVKKSKNDLNKFLGHLFGVSADEFGALSLREVTHCIKQIAELKASGELMDFIDAVTSLTK